MSNANPVAVPGAAAMLLALVLGPIGDGSPLAAEPRPGAPSGYELRILADGWQGLGLGYDYSTAWPLLRAASATLFVIRAGDLESFLWKTQRITLTPSATTRLLEALRKLSPRLEHRKLRAISGGRDLEWGLYQQGFVVLVDGEPIYGGIFAGSISQMAIDYPVIHAEMAGDRAVFHLLPIHLVWGLDPEFEETVGAAGGSLVEKFRQETASIDADIKASAPLPSEKLKHFRALIRDGRVQAALAQAGKLKDPSAHPR